MGNNIGCCDSPVDDSDFKNFCLSQTSQWAAQYVKTAIQKEAINNAVVEGDWGESQIKTGKGVIFYPHLFSYQGDVIDSRAEGQGTILWPNKAIYSGQVKSNKAHGFGQIKFYESSAIKGQWIEGQLAENLKIQYLNRGQRFVFEIIPRVQNSQNSQNLSLYVKIDMEEGVSYEGQIKKKGDCEFGIQGHGKMTFTDGSFYQGQFLQGKMHGKGKYFWGKSGHWYEGSYFNNYRDGQGTYYQSSSKSFGGIWKLGKYQLGEL